MIHLVRVCLLFCPMSNRFADPSNRKIITSYIYVLQPCYKKMKNKSKKQFLSKVIISDHPYYGLKWSKENKYLEMVLQGCKYIAFMDPNWRKESWKQVQFPNWHLFLSIAYFTLQGFVQHLSRDLYFFTIFDFTQDVNTSFFYNKMAAMNLSWQKLDIFPQVY